MLAAFLNGVVIMLQWFLRVYKKPCKGLYHFVKLQYCIANYSLTRGHFTEFRTAKIQLSIIAGIEIAKDF